ncbi:MAG TPA: bifunctional 3-demethylubiquinol 3-O-methyltransferase/2-polyprenyl-6-hydroxyphenol methylase [Legionella sp.]|nr:bifunctional 3-demethylubiquinol 3-O-methyltransferase/2-polyprenyl-6-hydroxyphenol methylase [Legionella sp.]
MKKNSTVDSLEVAKFAQHATEWWEKDGAFKTLHAINPVRLAFIQQFTSLAGQRVLDVGCGGGILCEGLAKRGAVVTGLDVGEDAIACAQAHALDSRLAIDYVCQPIETYDAALFDHITCMEMLEHVQHPEQVIKHCFRLLNKGGFLFLSTLNRTVRAYATAIVAAEYILGLLPRQTHDFEKFIKPSELARMVRAAGFETKGLSGLAYNPITSMATLDPAVDVNYLLVCQKP